MKIHDHSPRRNRTRGLSLIEITLVIGIMLTLASVITYSISSMTDWKRGKAASESLKSVYIAQKGFLADHPTETYSTLTSDDLLPYLPGRPGAIPTATSLEDQDLSIDFQVMPPILKLGETSYDPSDTNSDGLWDVGSL